ncbi:hypothetical protein D3C81_459900 [compost metagenome]
MSMSVKKRSLYVMSWQILRVSLDFSSVSGTDQSLTRCMMYLQKHGHTPANVYKVVNLYAATVMGLNGQIKRKAGKVDAIASLRKRIELIQEARKPLSKMYDLEKMDMSSFQVYDVARKQEIQATDRVFILAVHKDLKNRWINAHRRDYEVKRDELGEYLEMLETEMKIRGIKFTSAFRKGVKLIG